MSARTDALMSQQEAGKIAASIVLRYGRLSPGVEPLLQRAGRRLFPGFPDETAAWQERDGRYDESVNLEEHSSF